MDCVEQKQMILDLASGEKYSFMSSPEEFERLMLYMSDMWNKDRGFKINSTGYFKCSLNNLHKSQTRKRHENQMREPPAPKLPLRKTRSDAACCGSMNVSPHENLLKIKIIGHSCCKSFLKFPKIVKNRIDLALRTRIERTDHRILRAAIKAEILTEFESMNILPPTRGLADYIYGRYESIGKFKVSGNLVEACTLLNNSGCIGDILTVESGRYSGRQILSYIYKNPLELLKTLISKGFKLVIGLDSSHDICDKAANDNTLLLSAMFRCPDTLSYVIFGQAFIEGEDASSISLFLTYLMKFVPLEPDLILIDDSMAERTVIQNIWPRATIHFCYWHVIKTIRGRLEFRSQSMKFAKHILEEYSPEEIKVFDSISKFALVCLKTKSQTKFDLNSNQVITMLTNCQKWWNPKKSINDELRWWNQYLAKQSHWAVYSRMKNPLSMQEKTTTANERFHSILKQEELGKCLKRSDYVQAVVICVNMTQTWNQYHYTTAIQLFEQPKSTSLLERRLSLFFSLYPRVLVPVIRSEEHTS